MLWQRYFGVHQLLLNLGLRTVEYNQTEQRAIIDIKTLENPLVLLIAGQSNVANSVSILSQTQLPIYNFYRGILYQAKDPLLGATGKGGSIWLEVSRLLLEQTSATAIVLINVARDNSSIIDWQGNGQYQHLLNIAIEEAETAKLPVNLILWGQGERDAIDGMSQATYQQYLSLLIKQTKSYLPLSPVLVSKSSRCYGFAVSKNISQAQQAIITKYDHVLMGANTDIYGAQYRFDGCHFNELGRNAIAQDWAEKIQIALDHGSK